MPAAEFMNSCEEIHAVWFGFVDANVLIKAGTPYQSEVMDEPHYYLFGQAVGKIVFVLLIAALTYLIVT